MRGSTTPTLKTISEDPTRRDLLERAALISSAAAIAAAARATGATAEPTPQGALWPLWIECRTAHRRYLTAHDVHDKAWGAAELEYLPGPFIPIALHTRFGEGGAVTYELQERRADKTETTAGPEDERFVLVEAADASAAWRIGEERKRRRLSTFEAKRDGAAERHRVGELEAVQDDAFAAWIAIERRIANTPSEAPLDLAIKLHVLNEMGEVEPRDTPIAEIGYLDQALICSLCRDAERLFGDALAV